MRAKPEKAPTVRRYYRLTPPKRPYCRQPCLHEGNARKSADGSTTLSFDAAEATALLERLPAVRSRPSLSIILTASK
jgi:hypothetical protein